MHLQRSIKIIYWGLEVALAGTLRVVCTFEGWQRRVRVPRGERGRLWRRERGLDLSFGAPCDRLSSRNPV